MKKKKKKKKRLGSVNNFVPLATLSRLDPRSSSPRFVYGQPPRSTGLFSSLVTIDYP